MGKRLVSQIVLFTLLAQMLAPFAPQEAMASVTDLDRSLLNPPGNVLTNPGFEASRAAWTASGGTFTTIAKSSTPANVDAGSASGSWDSSTASQTLTTAFQTLTSGDGFSGQSGVVSCRFKCSTGTCTHTLTAYNGTTNIKTPVTIVSSTSAFVRQSLNFPYPGSGTVALRITSVNSNEPTLYVDSCYMGLAEGFNVFIGTTSNSPAKAGFISPTAATSCPAGWLDADGTAISRTTYPNYFANVGTTYGVGDGSTTVNLPDGRGVFLRGAGTQTISSIAHTGTQGTTQNDSIQGHRHSYSDPGHTHFVPVYFGGGGATGQPINGATSQNSGENTGSSTTNITITDPSSDGTNGTPRTGLETRPANISVKYCVKMYDDQSNSFFRPEAGGLAPGEESITSATSCPLGTIPENGASILRADYPELFAAIGTVYGSADGTHFNVPDHRGVFERGAGTQSIGGISYTGTQGTSQGDQFQGHWHQLFQNNNSTAGAANVGIAAITTGGNNSSWAADSVRQPISDGTNGTPRAGTETRPANISHLHCIRYLAAPPNPISAASTTGGGGASAINWVEALNAPDSSVDASNARVYSFGAGLGQALYAQIRVPTSYTAGNPISLKTLFYSNDTSGNALMQCVATLVRPTVDQFNSTTNQRTSTNTATTLSAPTQNSPQTISCDLTSSIGQINAVTVSAGYLINVKLTRATDTATSDLKVPVYGTEVTFQ